MHRLVFLWFLALPLGGLSGCDAWDVGNTEYGCSGLPIGVRCQSARDVYQQISGSDVAMVALARKAAVILRIAISETVSSPALETRPLRTVPRILRIWVVPWEDDQGDLHLPGTIVTEITSRRWRLGEPISRNPQPVLWPLQNPAVTDNKPVRRPELNLYGENRE